MQEMKKKIQTALVVVATVVLSQVFDHFWDQRDDYRPMFGTMSKGDVEYVFVGAIQPFRTNDIEKMSALLDQHSVTYSIECPDIVELWVPPEQEDRARSLFARDSRGLIWVNPHPRESRHVGLVILTSLCIAAIILPLFWWIESAFKKREREAIEQMHAEATSKSAPEGAISEASDA